ncbi:hypothetical protein DENSPDRAFT_34612 [Dentipellis sp. KUC8613]|nr:hypothetical protein DENSPDRAFT_34612 [Dentipellis sp. KUC8613]
MDPGELPWLTMGAGMISMDGNAGRNTNQMMRDMVTVMQRRHGEGDRLTSPQIQRLIDELPRLTEEDLEANGQYDGSCPICMNTYLAALAEEEMSQVMDSPAHPVENLGVTRLAKTCGHIFCRKDLLTWIRDGVSRSLHH